MIEDILVLEEQDFNPSLVVVAVSGWEPVGGQSVPSVDFVNQAKLSGETSSVDQSVQVGSCSECQTYSRSKLRLHWWQFGLGKLDHSSLKQLLFT